MKKQINFMGESVPDATTLCKFRKIRESQHIGKPVVNTGKVTKGLLLYKETTSIPTCG